MIYVDLNTGSKELEPLISRLGVPVEKSGLPAGDFCFEGKGPNGPLAVGVERKTLHDMLHCIDDARYNQQRALMKSLYDVSILVIEGHWKPHQEQGFLMEGFTGGISFGFCKYRTQRVMYHKLRRYLYSVTLSGVIVQQTRDMNHTAFDVVEWFHYFQKPWDHHTSLLEIQKLAIPTLGGRPSLVRKWANDIEGVGTKLSLEAERLFKKPITLANGDETDWLKIEGIGVKRARDIVREVWGLK